MLASICRRRRLHLALRQVSAGGDGDATNRIHSKPNTVLLTRFYSLTTSAPNSKPCPTTISYLSSCGVSPTTATLRSVRIRDTDRADAVRNLLLEYGFSDEEVTRTIRKAPHLLIYDPDRIIRPKLDFLLRSLGFQPRVLSTEPYILARSLDKHLSPCVDFLRSILGTDENIRHAVSRMPRAFCADVDNSMRPALEALRRHGLSDMSIAKLLQIHLGVLMMPLGRIAGVFEDLKELGVYVKETQSLYGFRAMCVLKRETVQRKVALYGSFGVSKDVVARAFKKQPAILLLSEENIKKKARFFLDLLKLELSSVLQQPAALTMSLEKCLEPRCAALSVLVREGKLKCKPKLPAALITDARAFSERFVLKHADDVPDVVKALEGKIKFEGFGDRELEYFSF